VKFCYKTGGNLLRKVAGIEIAIPRRCVRPVSSVSVLTKCSKRDRDPWRGEGDPRSDCPSSPQLKKHSVGDSEPEENRGTVHRSAETDAGVAAITLTCPRVLSRPACIPEALRFESRPRHYGTAFVLSVCADTLTVACNRPRPHS
jgi:hypothetical protein